MPDLLERIRKRDAKAMERIYSEHRNEFIHWSIGKFGINEEEALDHYQEVITLFLEKVLNGTLENIDSSIKTYLFGIGKNRVFQSFDEKKRLEKHMDAVSEHYQFLISSDESLEAFRETRSKAAVALNELGAACKELLQLFYFEKLSMSEIAARLGHKNEGVSRTTKKRCLEKIRLQMKDDK